MRTWASAYLGADVVRDRTMLGGNVVADGPYRHVRNPLYLGLWVHTLALALLMPASGAIFTLVLVGVFALRLILGEEVFLRGELGGEYVAYCALVPRLMPAFRPRVAASGAKPRWFQAGLAEIALWGVTASFAALGWRYNGLLLTKCVLVSLGVSLVVRGFAREGKAAN